jgi:Holliday junction resolvase RusA-like endonuclease
MKPEFYRLVIKGRPVIQQRARRGKYGNFYDPSKKERDALSLGLTYARVTAKMPVVESLLHLYVTFYGCGGRCDLDNLIKAVSDSANGVLWKDDKQITQIHAEMVREDADPRTEIEVVPIP